MTATPARAYPAETAVLSLIAAGSGSAGRPASVSHQRALGCLTTTRLATAETMELDPLGKQEDRVNLGEI